AYSPFASMNDIDNHVLRNLIFFDSMSLATYIEPSFSLSFQPSSAYGLSLDLTYFSVVSPKNGITRSEDTTTGIVTSYAGSGSTAGATVQSFSLTIGARVAL
ncbi:MAG TPA: omptin family outer membrane protease, partial [Spirochaetia bacterium]|nr:omptin family outer membrane protease [Spirochaetia bacterium]